MLDNPGLVGLIPKTIMLNAGQHYSQPHSTFSDEEYIRVAIENLGLDEFGPFHINERILEFALKI